jgi:hypothetical protein
MNNIIQSTFLIITVAFFSPFISGIKAIVECKLYVKSAKRIWFKFSYIISVIIAIILLFGIYFLINFLKTIDIGNYIMVLSYTILLAIISSKFSMKQLYVKSDAPIDSYKTAFKRGYTKHASYFFILYLPLNIIISVAYIFFLGRGTIV